MNEKYIHTLYRYNAWANARLWECIMALTDEQFVQDVGYSWGTVCGQVVHLMTVDERWFARIKGIPLPDRLQPQDFPTRAAARAKWDEIENAVQEYAQSVDDAQLARLIDYDMPHRGGMKRNAVWQIMAHVVNHATDHRAQIMAMLHLLGAPTAEPDLMFYLWENEMA